MSATLFLFFREIRDALGHCYSQDATVLATSQEEAERLLRDMMLEFAIQGTEGNDPRWKTEPAWVVETVPLDQPKVIGTALTGWPG